MRVVMFYHSLISDWNHGNAHFLRGVAGELMRRGHSVAVYEPQNAWSVVQLIKDHGQAPPADFYEHYPRLSSFRYNPATLDPGQVLDGADLVLVHEWNDPGLVARVGEHRARSARPYVLLFHDTHHRSVSEPESLSRYRLDHYDGVLAFGQVLSDLYARRGWARRTWVWHEAADTEVFRPVPGARPEGDVVWVGNWGDGERSEELQEFLLEPVAHLGLRASVYGVRYPKRALAALAASRVEYRGFLPNYRTPAVFGRFRVTVHVPRRPYVKALPGIPTIRPFEAMACGIPLVSAPWEDSEGLFTAGRDYFRARDGAEMKRRLKSLLADAALAEELAAHAHRTIEERHTCRHRVDELLAIHAEVAGRPADTVSAAEEVVA